MGIDFIQKTKLATNAEGELDLHPDAVYGSEQQLKNSESLYSNNDMVKLLESYLEETVPEEMRLNPLYIQFWAVVGRTIKLTFLDKDDIPEFMIYYDIARVDFMMSIPHYRYTQNITQFLDQLRIYYAAALKRSVGKGNFNERLILGSQTHQVIRSNTESFAEQGKRAGGLRGFLGGFF